MRKNLELVRKARQWANAGTVPEITDIEPAETENAENSAEAAVT